MIIKTEFVDDIPQDLEQETVYVSMKYATVVHSCFCGCGNEVVTPLSPTDWRIVFDGETVSLYPSVGSWNLDCKSHYWIRQNKVIWSDLWSEDRIEALREYDLDRKRDFYCDRGPTDEPADKSTARPSLWARFRSRLSM